MTTNAFVGDMFLDRGDAASPEVFTRVCTVFGLSGIGESNELVEATSFCSAGSREYIGGLADGEEFTAELNYEQANAQILAMIADVKAKTTRNFRLVVEHVSPSEVFSFAAVCLSWAINPSLDDKNTISFTFKISGSITVS